MTRVSFVIALVLRATNALAVSGATPSLLYVDDAQWRQMAAEAKLAAAQDFMRIFCGDPAMSAAALVDCLEKPHFAVLFDDALSCIQRRDSP